MNILSSVLELLKSLMILREIQSISSPNFMIIIGSHIQTSFTVVISFVFSSWIINEFEEFQSFSIVATLNSRYHELNSEYEQSSCKWNFGATFHFQCFIRYFHTSGVPLKGRDTVHWQKKRQPALTFLFQHFLDRCPFDKRPKKRKKNEKSTTYLRHSSVPPRLQKTWFVAKTLRARGRCFCWSADGKTRAWQDGCGQRGHWQIPGTLQRLREIWVVLILCSNRFFPTVHGAKRFSVEDGTGSKNALN